MKAYTLPLAVLLALAPKAAQAQIRVGIDLGLPLAPQMEIISPGIQVIAGSQEEIFLQGGWYWCRRSDGWYRSRTPNAHFDWIESRRVPMGLARMPIGRYRNWHHDGMRGPGGRGMVDGHRDDHRGAREEHRGGRDEHRGEHHEH